MMKRVDGEVIHCVIGPEVVEQFEALGFVQHVDDLPEDAKPKRIRRTKAQIAADKAND